MKLIIAKGVFKDIYYWGTGFASIEARAKWDAFWARQRDDGGSLVYVDYIDARGVRAFTHVSHFKECDIPTEIVNIAKAMVIEEMKSKCPLIAGKENA